MTYAYFTGKSTSPYSYSLLAYAWVYLQQPILIKNLNKTVGNSNLLNIRLEILGVIAFNDMKRVIYNAKLPWILKLFKDWAKIFAAE